MNKIVTALINFFKAFLAELHNFVVTAFSWAHIYAKSVLSISWKVAVILLITDILLKTKFGVFEAVLNIIKAFSGITLGGGIALALVAAVIGIGVTVAEQQKK